ncbi:MAG: sce7726 family protein [Desulfobacter sp.]
MKQNVQITEKFNQHLAKIFSRKIIMDLARNGESGYLNEILLNSGFVKFLGSDFKLIDIFDAVYKYLSKTYRNEYIYKNVIANKILLGRHSLNTSFMMTEFRVGSCKADVAIFNGTSNVYEIKTELDSLERLANQIAEYQKFFDKVQIITAPNQTNKISKSVGPSIGILELTPRNTIKTIQQAKSGKKRVSPETIFDSLRKSEYLSIIGKHYGPIPKVPNTQIYKECRAIFSKISPELAHDSMVTLLKQRGNSHGLKNFIESVPYSLKAIALNSCLKEKEAISFINKLNSSYPYLYSNAA